MNLADKKRTNAMDNVQILSTNKYNKFKLHYKNRKINYSKVEKLAAAIDKNNLLPIYPIVVNKKFEILDGQHRFEAAKSVKALVYYIVSNGNYGIENVADSNNFQSHWKLDDYINYYASDDREPYLKLIALSKKYNIASSFICNIHQLANISKRIKDGSFEFSNYNETVDVLKQAKTIGVEFEFKYWNTRSFLRAMVFITKVNGYNRLRLHQKLQANKFSLVKCFTAEDYIKLLEQVYNLNAVEPLRFL